MTDEPLVVPPSPGAALVRLSQVRGALERRPDIAGVLPADAQTLLTGARQALLNALEANDRPAVAHALAGAQGALRGLYAAACQPGLWNPDQAPAQFAALGFPDPLQPDLQPVDVAAVLATFSKPVRQILTTLSFDPAPGATAYWLHEVRFLRGERLQDAVVEANSPLFTRLRLPIGPHTFRIESRNPARNILSSEFSITVPEL